MRVTIPFAEGRPADLALCVFACPGRRIPKRKMRPSHTAKSRPGSKPFCDPLHSIFRQRKAARSVLAVKGFTSAKANKYLRRILNQAAHAAVKKKGSHFQSVFRRLLPRLGCKGAIWAIAHRLCRLVWEILHDGVVDVEHGAEPHPGAKRQRVQTLVRTLRKLGYDVDLKPTAPATA
jgi:hypothetical protein